ncbi:MAG: cytochrome c3 family protein [Sulfurimonas sp.]|nr:cytochrome c3 family protein [Sulfurimonas sp.]
MTRSIQFFYILLILFISETMLMATIIGSKHDLSYTNYYGTYAGATLEVCVFCHTPHAGNDGDFTGPLWNRKITDMDAFTLYSGAKGVPNNPTLVCLSCHDGVSGDDDDSAVAALDTHNIINGPGSGYHTEGVSPNCYACHFSGNMYPDQEWRVGPDLTDDHPVSISYDDAKVANPGMFENTPLNGVKLYDGMVECVSCHDPHNVDNPLFLRVDNVASDLCKSCHIK